MKRLSFFTKCSDRTYNLLSYHSPHSLTWRWLLGFDITDKRFFHFGFYNLSQPNGNRHIILSISKITLRFISQRPMLYRDLYLQIRNEQDIQSGMERK